MRLPDDNGVQPGSLKIPVHVGDGGNSANNGKMGASALPNIKGTYARQHSTAALARNDSIVDGAFEILPKETTTPPTQVPTTGNYADARPLGFNAKLYDPMYQDGVTEVRANRMQGCWTVRYAAKATNGGSIDALALATAISAGDAELLAKIITTNARIDYAMIAPETNPTLGSRTIYDNPFGSNTPVFCVAEFYQSNLSEWINTGQTYASSTSQWGLRAGYAEGKGIVLIIGNTGLNIGGLTVAGNFGTNTFTANYTTASPVRIHVWKITA